MIKRFFFIVVLVVVFLFVALPVHAQGVGTIYVDKAWTGSENGTQSNPYNTEQEGINAARNSTGGAFVYIKQPDGTWGTGTYYAPTYTGGLGTPLPPAVLYTLLALLALVLILLGWYFQRRSKQLRA